MRNLEDFVKQVPEVDYLNLFVSSLGEADSSKVLFRDIARDDRKSYAPFHSRGIEGQSMGNGRPGPRGLG